MELANLDCFGLALDGGDTVLLVGRGLWCGGCFDLCKRAKFGSALGAGHNGIHCLWFHDRTSGQPAHRIDVEPSRTAQYTTVVQKNEQSKSLLAEIGREGKYEAKWQSDKRKRVWVLCLPRIQGGYGERWERRGSVGNWTVGQLGFACRRTVEVLAWEGVGVMKARI